MSQDVDPEFYLRLSVARRLQLVDEIMDSVARDTDGAPLGADLGGDGATRG